MFLVSHVCNIFTYSSYNKTGGTSDPRGKGDCCNDVLMLNQEMSAWETVGDVTDGKRWLYNHAVDIISTNLTDNICP